MLCSVLPFFVLYGFFPATLDFGGSDKLDIVVDRFDIEKAKQILADAGYADKDGDGIVEKDGAKLSLNYVYDSKYNEKVKFAELLASNAALAGIELNLIEAGQNQNDMVKAGEFDITTAGGGMAPTGNPQYYINTVWTSTASKNWYGYSNPEVDRLGAELEATFDPDKRDALALEIEQILMDDMFFIVHTNKQFYCAHTNDVVNFKAQPSEYYLLDNIFEIK